MDSFSSQPRAFSFELFVLPDFCKGQPPADAWVWPGRDYCWQATKIRACYGQHTWLEAQEQAAAAGQSLSPHVVPFPALQDSDMCDKPLLGAEITLAEVDSEVKLAAQRWFRSNVAVFVLNLPTAVQRWRIISARLAELGIEATRIPGVDVSTPGALEKAKEEGILPAHWDFDQSEKQMLRLLQNSSVTTIRRYITGYGVGTVGCAAAHLRAMITAENDAIHLGKPLVLILEDDTWLESDFIIKLERLLRKEAPCDWQVISLRSQCSFGKCISPHLSRVQPDGNEPKEMCRRGVNYGFYAMLYRASTLGEVAHKLAKQVWDVSKPACLAQDIALASISNEVAYYAVPSSQVPGFLQHGAVGGSVRSDLNQRGAIRLDGTILNKMSRVSLSKAQTT